MSKSFKIILIVLVLSITGFVIWLKNKEQKNNKYDTVKPVRQNIKDNRFVLGTISPLKEVEIVPHISGIIEEIFVETGETVNQGDPIAKIKLIASPEAIERGEKNLKIAQLNNDLKIKEYNRKKKLFNKRIIPKSEFEPIETNWIQSEEELKSAIKQLQIVKQGYTREKRGVSDIIKSTIHGTVLEIPLKAGASVTERNTFNNGSTIAIIADMDELIFRGKISEQDLFFLSENMFFNTKIPALKNKLFKTQLIKIATKGMAENGIIKFEFEGKLLIDNTEDLPVRTGYSGISEFIIEEAKDVITVEEKDIIYDSDSSFVEIVNHGKKQLQSVKVGVCDGVFCEIKEGLEMTNDIVIQD